MHKIDFTIPTAEDVLADVAAALHESGAGGTFWVALAGRVLFIGWQRTAGPTGERAGDEVWNIIQPVIDRHSVYDMVADQMHPMTPVTHWQGIVTGNLAGSWENIVRQHGETMRDLPPFRDWRQV